MNSHYDYCIKGRNVHKSFLVTVQISTGQCANKSVQSLIDLLHKVRRFHEEVPHKCLHLFPRQGHLVTTASLVVRGCWMSGRQNHERAEQVIIKSTRKISESQLSFRVF